jgi:hypothetical protein
VGEIEASLPVAIVPDDRWKVTSSHASATAANAFTLTGWSTGASQQAGMWFQIELPAATPLIEMQFASPPQGGGRGGPPPAPTYPRQYRVEVSADGASWTTALGDVRGVTNATTITLEPTAARFVRIVLTADAADAPAWTMQRLRLYRHGPTPGGR